MIENSLNDSNLKINNLNFIIQNLKNQNDSLIKNEKILNDKLFYFNF